jgi:peroxiredoxin
MSLKLGDEFPNFALKTTTGNFQLHDWLGDRSVIFLLLIEYHLNI